MYGKGYVMSYQIIGAIMIFSGCGAFGFSLASSYAKKKNMFNQLLRILQLTESELQYKLSPLPELFRHASEDIRGPLKNVFLNFSRELDWHSAPDAYSCMKNAIKITPNLPIEIRKILNQLGHTLGRFDLQGQLQGIQAVKQVCNVELKRISDESVVRVRSYQTLGLCTGAALAILFA